MQQNEGLYYLIAGFLSDWCDIELFCDEFYKMYDLESQYCATNKAEEQAKEKLSDQCGVWSESYGLKVPPYRITFRVYYIEG